MSDKLTELALYVLQKEPDISDNKLAWILWYSDIETYAQTGHSLTGTTWAKGETCPFPTTTDPLTTP